MRILKPKEDERLREEFHDLKLIATNHGTDESFYNEKIVFYHSNKENYPINFHNLMDFIDQRDPETLYALLYENDQEDRSKPIFNEKYEGRSAEIEIDEINEVEKDLDVIYLLPEGFGWLIKLDRDDNIRFYGDKEFMDEVKDFFPNWKELTERPEKAQ